MTYNPRLTGYQPASPPEDWTDDPRAQDRHGEIVAELVADPDWIEQEIKSHVRSIALAIAAGCSLSGMIRQRAEFTAWQMLEDERKKALSS